MGKDKKRTTVYEDRQSHIEKHTVLCPHCQNPVLDHLTKCPHCGGELTPNGYKPPNPKTMKIIKIVSYTVGFAIAIALVIVLMLK